MRAIEEETLPDLTGFMTAHQEVVDIFSLRAARAARGGGEAMPEPGLIGWEAPASHEPVEDPAFERGGIAPNLSGLVISRNKLKKIGIEIFVSKRFLGGAANTVIRNKRREGKVLEFHSQVLQLTAGLSGKPRGQGEREV